MANLCQVQTEEYLRTSIQPLSFGYPMVHSIECLYGLISSETRTTTRASYFYEIHLALIEPEPPDSEVGRNDLPILFGRLNTECLNNILMFTKC